MKSNRLAKIKSLYADAWDSPIISTTPPYLLHSVSPNPTRPPSTSSTPAPACRPARARPPRLLRPAAPPPPARPPRLLRPTRPASTGPALQRASLELPRLILSDDELVFRWFCRGGGVGEGMTSTSLAAARLAAELCSSNLQRAPAEDGASSATSPCRWWHVLHELATARRGSESSSSTYSCACGRRILSGGLTTSSSEPPHLAPVAPPPPPCERPQARGIPLWEGGTTCCEGDSYLLVLVKIG
jgi:hypothetical protein